MIAEPKVVVPEKVFESIVLEAVCSMAKDADWRCLVMPRFGLDLAFFLEKNGRTCSRFLEAKVYAGARPGGVGFGSPKGEGPQVELLLYPNEDLQIVNDSVRWVLADATRPLGSARYSLFDSQQAKAASMNGVQKGKQNNLRISSLEADFMAWPEFLEKLRQFVLG